MEPPGMQFLAMEAQEVLNPESYLAIFNFLYRLYVSSSETAKSEAERLYDYLRENHLGPFALRLAFLLSSSGSAHPLQQQIFAALSRILAPDWSCLSVDQRNEIKPILLDYLKNQNSRSSLHKICDFLSNLASQNIPGKEWPEILQFIFLSLDSSSEIAMESALLLLSKLGPDGAGEGLLEGSILDYVYQSLLKILRSVESLDLRLAAAKASIGFVLYWTIPSNQSKYEEIFPLIKETLSDLLEDDAEECAMEILENLIGLARAKPGFLPFNKFASVINCMVLIIQEDECPDEARVLALEFVLTLAEEREHSQEMLLKFPHLLKVFIVGIMAMLADIDDGQMESKFHAVGMNALVRLADALGDEVLIDHFPDQFDSLFEDEDWKFRHAAAVSVAAIANTCSKTLDLNLMDLARFVTKLFQGYIHPAVHYAGLNCIKELSKYLSREFHVLYHQEVLPILTNAMDYFDNPPVQLYAALATLHFAKKCPSTLLKPYLNQIVSKLIKYLEQGEQGLKQAALGALASVGRASKDRFQDYYSTVMPYLKVIIRNGITESNRTVFELAVECITLIFVAVGKEMISNDIEMIVEVLMSLQLSKWEAGDPTRRCVLQAWGKLCECLGQDFRPHMAVAIPQLLESARLRSYVIIPDDLDTTERLGDSIKPLTLGNQKVFLRTKVLEEKMTACTVLYSCAAELKETMHAWNDEVARTFIPLLKFELDTETRWAAISAMPVLLRSSKAAIEKQLIKWHQNSFPFEKLCLNVVTALIEALDQELLSELRVRIFDSLKECMQISGPILDAEKVKLFLNCMMKFIYSSSLTRSSMGDNDPTEQERAVKVYYKKAGDCLKTFITTYKGTLSQYFDHLEPFIESVWHSDKTAKERKIGLRVFHDVAEQGQGEAIQFYSINREFLFRATKVGNPEVQKVSAKAIGVWAEFGGVDFKSDIQEAVFHLKAMIEHPKALHWEYAMARDAAVSALGKILAFQHNKLNSYTVFLTWLDYLPLRDDPNEAKENHNLLCSIIEELHRQAPVGQDNSLLRKLIVVYTEVICGKSLATEQTMSLMINQLKRYKKRFATNWEATMLTLDPYIRRNLQSKLLQ